MCGKLFIRHVIGDCIDFPRMAIRVKCPNLVLPRVAADCVIFIDRDKARICKALPGQNNFLWRLHQNPKVIQRSVCKRLFGLIESELNRRRCDIEVCIPWPHFVRVLSKEGCVEAGARFNVLNI
jgi:hypothetical protein